MFRRDFLKFAGLVGATLVPGVSLPEVKAAESALQEQIPEDSNSPIITFKYGDESWTVVADEASLQWSELQTFDYILKNGVLEDIDKSRDKFVEFSLIFQVLHSIGSFEELKAAPSFDLVYHLPDKGNVVYFTDCRWDSIEWELVRGFFSFEGRCPIVRTDSTTGPGTVTARKIS